MAKTRDMTQPVLEIEDLNISFFVRAGEIPAVMDFSCKVMPGETMGLVGESGCGKSTVALGIMRDMGNRGKIVGGKIKFMGRDMGEMSEDELRDLRGSKIAMIYQEPMASLNPAMKIGKQLMEVPIIHEGVSEEEAYARALEMLENVKLPDPARVMKAYPHQISGGQQQRIVIAMALLSEPDLLLLDEPTTALDVTVEAGIVELVKELGRKTGTSMLFISHNLGLILETCDKITVMYSGEAVETGTVHDVFDRMRHPYTQGLFNSIPLPGADKNSKPLIAIPGQLPLPMERPVGCNFGPRCEHYVESICNAGPIKMQAVGGKDEDGPSAGHMSRCARIAQIDWMAEPERRTVDEVTKPGDVVLEINDLKKYYDVAANKMFGGGDTRTVKANESITFNAREAETVAIVGESGCGKSTLAKVLLGLETSTSGQVLLDGKEIGKTMVSDRDRRTVAAVQMVFQNPFDTLNPSHSVGSQIIRTLEKFGIGETEEDRKQRMLELLDLVKLPRAFAERMPRQLSGGQKQRIGVARAFAGEPRVVVADEPVSALDVSVQAAVTELLMDIQREARTTMLFISHDLSVVRYIADRVVVMYLGHIVEQGSTDAIFSPPYHPYTEALLSAIPIADTSVEKKHILLDGDIPSAMNPPSGCPFQTRCPRKSQVPGDLCETTMPPVRDLGDGHQVKCHLSEKILASMEPVIVLGDKKGTTPAVKSKPASKTKASAQARGKAKSAPGKKSGTAAAVAGGAAALAGQSAVGSATSSGSKAKPTAPKKTAKPKTAAKPGTPAAKKTTAKSATATKTAATAKKSGSAGASAKKSAASKSAASKSAASKSAASKPAASKATPAKTATSKATTTKASASKSTRAKPVASAAKAADKTAAKSRGTSAVAKRQTKATSKSTSKSASSSPSKARVSAATSANGVVKPAGFAAIRKPKTPDDLKMIAGVGPKIEGILNGLGVYTFKQVSQWKKADRDWVNAELSFKGRIEREDWVKQARALAKGGEAEYIKVFGKKPR